MHWVIQNNMFWERAVVELGELLERYEIPHTTVKVIPFGGGLDPDVDIEGPVVVVGSMSLARHAKNKGWSPGAWMGRSEEDFTYTSYLREFGTDMLNHDSLIVPFRDLLAHGHEKFFVRPVTDGKLFAGTVLSRDEAEEWGERISQADSTWTVTPDTPIVISPLKNIRSETRFVVVNGEVVTGSVYKRGSSVIYSPDVERRIWEFADGCARWWTPDDVCVMDIAATDEGLKIVEFNNFNSAGWYACDVSAIVQAIDR